MFAKRNYLILTSAFLAFVFSVYLWFSGQTEEGVFVGVWVPSILALGIFINLAVRKV